MIRASFQGAYGAWTHFVTTRYPRPKRRASSNRYVTAAGLAQRNAIVSRSRVPMLLLLAGCTSAPSEDSASPVETGKDADCASTFGDTLTDAFGRVDGTLVAVVEPGNTRCAEPNSDHVIVQVAFGGAVYRMVVNVLSSGDDTDIRVGAYTAPLPAPAFAEGWHPGLGLDYTADLGAHSTDPDWEALPMADAATRVADALTIGAPLAVYATSSGGSYADSTHLIHRNGEGNDGALVLDPTGASPTWLLFHFADQEF